jgi:1-acyl-sn-glycerol-3-phosphate acyltransferase
MTHDSNEKSATSIFDRRFGPLFFTQFLGAFNDNLFKNALVITLTFGTGTHAGMTSEQLVALSSGVFILPYFILSALAGQIADKFPKAVVIRWVKFAEIPIMVLASIGFITESTTLLFATLFFAGVQASLFGPLKYGVLPELLESDQLVRGNALIEMGTFLAILLGTIAGGVLIALKGIGPTIVSASIIVVAILGVVTAQRLPRGAPADPELRIDRGIITPTWRLLKLASEPRSVLNSILGISWFWLLGASVLSVLPALVTKHLAADESVVTYLLALFSIGVAVGSLLCERLSFRQLELGLVPIGSLGITAFLLDVALSLGPDTGGKSLMGVGALLGTSAGIRISVSLFLFSIASGIFIVPLYTLLQERSAKELRARVIAANNVANAGFMVLGSLLLVGLFKLGATIPQILALLALLNLAVAIYIYTVIPEFAFRFVCFMLAHVLYRLKVEGRERIPLAGPAVLVCNHVTFIDWLVISAACQRPMRFVMHHSFLKLPLTGRFFRDVKVIPIAGMKEDPAILEAAFARIAQELREGELVCLFPEGKLTTDGDMAPFRTGVERILKENPVPVIPMHLGGLWQSVFSRYTPRRPLRRVWSRVRLVVGNPLPPEGVSAALLEDKVRDLAGASETAVPALVMK